MEWEGGVRAVKPCKAEQIASVASVKVLEHSGAWTPGRDTGRLRHEGAKGVD